MKRILGILKALKQVILTYPAVYNSYLESKKQKNLLKQHTDLGVSLLGNNDIRNTIIGKHTYVANNTIIHTTDLGRYCSIGPNCVIGYGDHPSTLFSTSPLIYHNRAIYGDEVVTERINQNFKRVTIGNDVWIASNVFIKNGITIGNGAIVGAGAVVLTDIPDYAIAVGTPAKVIKYRFEPEVIQLLLKSEWWSKDLEEVEAFKEIISSNNLELIIRSLTAQI